MKDPLIVSILDLRRFIMEQANDRPHRMNEVGYYSPIGCYLVHYGKDRGWIFNHCANRTWVRYRVKNMGFLPDTKIAEIGKDKESHVYKIFRKDAHAQARDARTYGELKLCLIE